MTLSALPCPSPPDTPRSGRNPPRLLDNLYQVAREQWLSLMRLRIGCGSVDRCCHLQFEKEKKRTAR
jgi:hypothetical protein